MEEEASNRLWCTLHQKKRTYASSISDREELFSALQPHKRYHLLVRCEASFGTCVTSPMSIFELDYDESAGDFRIRWLSLDNRVLQQSAHTAGLTPAGQFWRSAAGHLQIRHEFQHNIVFWMLMGALFRNGCKIDLCPLEKEKE